MENANGERGGALSGGDFDALGTGAASKAAFDGAGDGPVQVAAERLQRQRDGVARGGAAFERTELGLQALLGGLELAGQLRVEVALTIDVADQIGARRLHDA